MKLLGGGASPYARKVRVVIEEKKVACETVAASPGDPKSGVAAANPLSKIPVLVRDDGKAVYDSPVIVEYLDGVGTGPKLIPEAFVDRIEVKRWEALGDGICDATIEIVHDQRLPEGERHGEALWAKQQKKIDAGLAVMEKDLGSREFCHGSSFSLADIVCGVAVGYLDQAQPKFDWRKSHPNLKRHAEKLAARDSFKKTAPVKT